MAKKAIKTEDGIVNTPDDIIEETPIRKDKTEITKNSGFDHIDSDQYVNVRNGFHGVLVYVSSKTGETYTWDDFDDVQEMTLRELKGMKSSQKSFFENNWILFDEDWIYDYLGVRQMYKYTIKNEDLEKLFEMPIDKMKKIVSGMGQGQKESFKYMVKDRCARGELDSLKRIKALEEALGTNLLEN